MKIRNLLVLLIIGLGTSISAQDTILIKNVNVWDGTSDKLKENHSVLIIGNLIEDVAKKIDVPENTTIIDGKGKTLIPGLSDAHVHLAMTLGVKALRNEADWMYTSVRATKAAENF